MTIRDATFSRTPRGVTLQGTTTPGAEVTTENLSAAPFGPTTVQDTFATARADAQGRFAIEVPLAVEGDKVSVTTGKGASLLSVRLAQAGVTDGRRAEVGHQGLRLVEKGEGAWGFAHVRKSQRLGEPGARLELVSRRTQERFAFELDAKGRLPADASVKGEPGDTFTLHVTDGFHNQYLHGGDWSALTIPLSPDERGVRTPVPSGTSTVRLDGPLFKDGPEATDAEQGRLGDCYMVATAAGFAAAQPERLQSMFRENDDGTVTVTFKRYDEAQGAYVDEPITIDREVPAQWGSALYGRDDEAGRAAKMESWFPLMEKAYAAWKGSYDAIECGYPYEMFEAMLGTEGEHIDTRGVSADALYKRLEDAMANKAIGLVWTGGEAPGRAFTNSGLYGDHAYTLLGVHEQDGERFVKLRNPWGQAEPSGDGKDDGIFTMPLERFMTYFVGVGLAS